MESKVSSCEQQLQEATQKFIEQESSLRKELQKSKDSAA